MDLASFDGGSSSQNPQSQLQQTYISATEFINQPSTRPNGPRIDPSICSWQPGSVTMGPMSIPSAPSQDSAFLRVAMHQRTLGGYLCAREPQVALAAVWYTYSGCRRMLRVATYNRRALPRHNRLGMRRSGASLHIQRERERERERPTLSHLELIDLN